MKKIGIITLNGYSNFGNRLQNYALQEVLESHDCDVKTILIKKEAIIQKKSIIERLKGKSINHIYNKLKSKSIKHYDTDREKIFIEFTNDFINESDYKISISNTSIRELDDFDYFVTGSDQVWNPANGQDTPLYFLNFVDKDKRLSYAASFGVSKIGNEYVQDYKHYIDGMYSISTREIHGKEIVKNLTDRESLVHVDPTLLISQEKWKNISKEHTNKTKQKFILTYFLGDIPKKEKNKIKKMAHDNDLVIINLADPKDKDTYIKVGPREFLDYINTCELFCTDSFHGVIFSIIFKRPFIVYRRIVQNDMYSRIETLLENFSLEDRQSNTVDYNDVFTMDYTGADTIIERENRRSNEYISEMIER